MHYVRAVLAGARRGGLDLVPLLQEAQIPPLLLGDDRARITPAQFARLFRALYRTTQDEFLGLSGVPSRPGTFAMMCHACLGCRDLGAAVRRAAAFYGLFPGGPELALEVEGGQARFTVRNAFDGDEERFLSECVLAIWHRLSSWLIGRRIPLSQASFAYPPPPHADEYATLFACPVRFGAGLTGAAFDARWLTAPLVRDEAALDAMLRRAPFDLLSRPEYGTTVAEQVRRSLTQRLRESPRLPELGEVAARLAVSPRPCGGSGRRARPSRSSRTTSGGTRPSRGWPRAGSRSRNSPPASASRRTPPSTARSAAGRAPPRARTGSRRAGRTGARPARRTCARAPLTTGPAAHHPRDLEIAAHAALSAGVRPSRTGPAPAGSPPRRTWPRPRPRPWSGSARTGPAGRPPPPVAR